MKKKKLVAKITSICMLLGMTLGSTMMVNAENQKFFVDAEAEEGKPYVLPFIQDLDAPDFNWESYKTNTSWGELTLRGVESYRLVMKCGEEYAPYGKINGDHLGEFNDDAISDLETAIKNAPTLSYLDVVNVNAIQWAGCEDEQVYREKIKATEILVVSATSSDIVANIPLVDIGSYVGTQLPQSEVLLPEYAIRVATKAVGDETEIIIAWNITDMKDKTGTLVYVDGLAIEDKDGVEVWATTATSSEDPDHVVTAKEYLPDGTYNLVYTIREVEFRKAFTVSGTGVGSEFTPEEDTTLESKEPTITVSDIPEDGIYTHESLDITFRSDMPVSFTFNGTTHPTVGKEFTFNVTENGEYTFEAITEDGVVTANTITIKSFTEKDEFAIEDRDEYWEGKADIGGLVQTGILSNTLLVVGAILAVGGAIVLFVKGGKKKNETK